MDAGSSFLDASLLPVRLSSSHGRARGAGDFTGQANLPRLYAIALRILVYSLFLWAALFL